MLRVPQGQRSQVDEIQEAWAHARLEEQAEARRTTTDGIGYTKTDGDNMKCELKIIARDVKEAIIFLPTAGGITHFGKVLLAEAIVIVPTGVLAGINVLIGTVLAFVVACATLMYYNARCECKEAWKGELLMQATNTLGKDYVKETLGKGG